MGFYLLHESMLDAVIFARDKFLKNNECSAMLPSHATIYSAPCSLENYLNEKVMNRTQMTNGKLSEKFVPPNSKALPHRILIYLRRIKS